MKAFAWRRETEDPKANYCLQVENIKGKRALNKVVKILGDWEIIGDGYNAKTEEYTMILLLSPGTLATPLISIISSPISGTSR